MLVSWVLNGGVVRMLLPTRGGKAGRTGGSGCRVMRREDRCRREEEKWEVGGRVSEACSVYRQGAVMCARRRGREGKGREGGRGRVRRATCVLDVRLRDQSITAKCGIVVTFNVSFALFFFLSFPSLVDLSKPTPSLSKSQG
jgi:hypothetical protein